MNAVAQAATPDVNEVPAPLVFTDSAADKVKQLIEEEGNPELKLRVFVQGGGCSGFQYGFTFDEDTNEDDTTMTKNGVTLLIDSMSYQYLVAPRSTTRKTSTVPSSSSRTRMPRPPAVAVRRSRSETGIDKRKSALRCAFLLPIAAV